MDKFRHINTWVFDLDNTLYDANTGVFNRIVDRMTLYVSDLLRISPAEANALRRTYWQKYGTTLYGLMKEHKVDPAEFLKYAHEIDISDVSPCGIIREYLAYLPGKKIIFTNSSREFAQRMTRHLGIDHHFDHMFSIEDAAYLPKPQPGPYHAVIENAGFDPQRAVMFDDMEVNLKTAAELGLTTVWIHGDNKNPADHALPHLHHKAEKLSHWLLATVKPREAGQNTITPQHPTKRK